MRDVLDTAGSLSDGGRFNIGGAQASSHNSKAFLGIGGKRSALYLGEDVVVVRKECGDFAMPDSKAATYSVHLKRRKHIDLIDVTLALNSLSNSIPNINEIIGSDSRDTKPSTGVKSLSSFSRYQLAFNKILSLQFLSRTI